VCAQPFFIPLHSPPRGWSRDNHKFSRQRGAIIKLKRSSRALISHICIFLLNFIRHGVSPVGSFIAFGGLNKKDAYIAERNVLNEANFRVILIYLMVIGTLTHKFAL
jgi:hypothetical protein